MRKLLMIIILLFTVCAMQGQVTDLNKKLSLIVNEIKKINNLTLNKHETQYALEIGYQLLTVYSHNDKIRKIHFSYTEGGAVSYGFGYTEYFDEKGNLLFHFYKNYDREHDHALLGTGYFKDGNTLKKQCYDGNNTEYPFVRAYTSEERTKHCYHLTVNDLKKHFAFNIFTKIKFDIKPNESSYIINSSKVLVREAPNTKSKILFRLNPSDRVKIISVGKKENISYWGENNWYQIKYLKYTHNNKEHFVEGWIFGAFIEPNEIEE